MMLATSVCKAIKVGQIIFQPCMNFEICSERHELCLELNNKMCKR